MHQSHIERTSCCNDKSLLLSFLPFLSPRLSLTSCDSVTAFHKADSALGLSFVSTWSRFSKWFVLQGADICRHYSATTLLIRSICACVSTCDPGCVGWVCLLHMYPASIFCFLWAAGLSSTSQAQMAFDNGWNAQMPGRHLAIDHSSKCCVHFPCRPPGEQYLKLADWLPPCPPPLLFFHPSIAHPHWCPFWLSWCFPKVLLCYKS